MHKVLDHAPANGTTTDKVHGAPMAPTTGMGTLGAGVVEEPEAGKDGEGVIGNRIIEVGTVATTIKPATAHSSIDHLYRPKANQQITLRHQLGLAVLPGTRLSLLIRYSLRHL